MQFDRAFGYEKAIELINKIDLRYRPHYFIGLGYGRLYNYGVELKRFLKMIKKIDREYRTYCYEGLGEKIGRMWALDNYLDKWLDLINKNIDEEYLPYCYKGLGKGLSCIFNNEAYLTNLANKVKKKYRGYFYEGLREEEDF
jgi:hypothetical protein